jgi:hypothetical protein
MTSFSYEIINCLASWTQELQSCKGDPKCIEECGKGLRKRLDIVFPPSTKLEFDNDKISYVFSTLFFLSNRLNKALVGLAEIDAAINNLVSDERSTISNNNSDSQDRQKFRDILNKVLSDYY